MSRQPTLQGKTSIIAGVFVGGRGSRMGGMAKGLIRGADRVTLIERWRSLFQEIDAQVVLVGASDAYRDVGLPMLADDPGDKGPLGGLAALLGYAEGRQAIAVACDMPWVSKRLLERLIDSDASAAVLAARYGGRWEPFFARYDAARALPVVQRCLNAHKLALHQFLDEAEAVELTLTDEEIVELRDWDTPEDVHRDGCDFPR